MRHIVVIAFAALLAACGTDQTDIATSVAQPPPVEETEAETGQARIEPTQAALKAYLKSINNTLMPLYSGHVKVNIELLISESTINVCHKSSSGTYDVNDCLNNRPDGGFGAPITLQKEGPDGPCLSGSKREGPFFSVLSICVSKARISGVNKSDTDGLPDMPYEIEAGQVYYIYWLNTDNRPPRDPTVYTLEPPSGGATSLEDLPNAAADSLINEASPTAQETDCEAMRVQLQDAKQRQQQAFGPDLPAAIQNEIAIAIRMETSGCNTSPSSNSPDTASATGAAAAQDAVDAALDAADAAEAAAASMAGYGTGAASSGSSGAAGAPDSAAETVTDAQLTAGPVRSLDAQFRERANEDCPRGFLGKACRQQIRDSLCTGKWSSDPKPGETECRR